MSPLFWFGGCGSAPSFCRYRLDVVGKSLPVLTNSDKGKFGVIVFENLDKYLRMDKWNRELLDKYCGEYGVGIVGFIPPTEQAVIQPLRGFPLLTRTRRRLKVSLKLPLSPSFLEKTESEIQKNTKNCGIRVGTAPFENTHTVRLTW